MHDYIFFSGQIIFNEFDQLKLVVKMDAGFQTLLVFRRQVGDCVGEYPDGVGFAVFPQGDIAIMNTKQKPKEQTHG